MITDRIGLHSVVLSLYWFKLLSLVPRHFHTKYLFQQRHTSVACAKALTSI